MTDVSYELVTLMPVAKQADEAGGANRPAYLVANRRRARRQRPVRVDGAARDDHGARLERRSYRMTMLGDRYLVEVWFAGDGRRVMVGLESRLAAQERR